MERAKIPILAIKKTRARREREREYERIRLVSSTNQGGNFGTSMSTLYTQAINFIPEETNKLDKIK